MRRLAAGHHFETMFDTTPSDLESTWGSFAELSACIEAPLMQIGCSGSYGRASRRSCYRYEPRRHRGRGLSTGGVTPTGTHEKLGRFEDDRGLFFDGVGESVLR